MITLKEFNRFIPDSKAALERLKFLKEESQEIRIAVFGKFNHGKSTLLNAIIGQEIFKTADKRQTVKNAEYLHNEIIWIDTPGLDADIKGLDDTKAMAGAFKMADFVFLVHRVDTGELDKHEMQLYHDLIQHNATKKMCLVLTQIDQLDNTQLDQVISTITKQMPELSIIPVSATRYQKGKRDHKQIFVERSGLQVLFEKVEQFVTGDIQASRQSEINMLIQKITAELEKMRFAIESELYEARANMQTKKEQFNVDLQKYINAI